MKLKALERQPLDLPEQIVLFVRGNKIGLISESFREA